MPMVVEVTDKDPRGDNLGLQIMKDIMTSLENFAKDAMDKGGSSTFVAFVRPIAGGSSAILKIGNDEFEFPSVVHDKIDPMEFAEETDYPLVFVETQNKMIRLAVGVKGSYVGEKTEHNFDVDQISFRFSWGAAFSIYAGWRNEKELPLMGFFHYPSDWYHFGVIFPEEEKSENEN